MTLHEAIIETLRMHNNRWMTVREIADYIEANELFEKMNHPANQVSARIGKKEYQHLCEIDKSVYPRKVRAATV